MVLWTHGVGGGSLLTWSSLSLRPCGPGAQGWGFLNIPALLLMTANLCMVSVVGLGWEFPPPIPVIANLCFVSFGYRILNPKSFLTFSQGWKEFASTLPLPAMKFCLPSFKSERISYPLLDLVLLGFVLILPLVEMDLSLYPESLLLLLSRREGKWVGFYACPPITGCLPHKKFLCNLFLCLHLSCEERFLVEV